MVEKCRVYLVQAGEDVRHVNDGIAKLVDLMENIVPEELDDIPITSLAPPGIAGESSKGSQTRRTANGI